MPSITEKWVQDFATRWSRIDPDEDVGLYWVIKEVSEYLVDANDTMVMEQSLRTVRAMLEAGMIAACSPFEDGDYIPWPDQTPDAVLARIRREWLALGREPNIPDAPWFWAPNPA